MHKNPVSGKWSIVDDFVKYPHSTASFYEEDIQYEFVDLLHYREVEF